MQQTNTKSQPASAPFVYDAAEDEPESGAAKVRRWTIDEYYKMAELGFFDGKRVELIEGEIIEMSPMKVAHATALTLLIKILTRVFSEDYVFRSQLPMSFGNRTEPEPDLAIVKGDVRDFSRSHPKTAALVVEVSDPTLRYDKTTKAALYAKNKIQEYWILNLKNRCLEVYRRPIRDKKLGFAYTEILIFTETESAATLEKPDARIEVADLLP